jgi:hypothetical protein
MSVATFFDLNANAKFTSILSWAVARAQRVQMTRLNSSNGIMYHWHVCENAKFGEK